MVLSIQVLPSRKNGQIFEVNNFVTREKVIMAFVKIPDLSSGLMGITNDIYRCRV